jgi:hypothetical protein
MDTRLFALMMEAVNTLNGGQLLPDYATHTRVVVIRTQFVHVCTGSHTDLNKYVVNGRYMLY